MTDVAQFKYRAFLSYSHRDRSWGKWLHTALESYRVDRDLVGRETPVGPVPKTLRPIFRDREDFSAGHSLTEQTLAALEASQFLIVLCSPNAAQSRYVNEEVRRFKIMGRSDRVIPIIVDGQPGSPDRECFPQALRFKVGPDGKVTEEAQEPIAADARREGDGRQIAKQKTIAGLLGLPLDEIVRRTERARKRANAFWGAFAGLFLLLAVAAGGSAVYAYQKLFQSEERLDSAIEIAYGFVAEATEISDRFGVPIEVSLGLLRRAEVALDALITRGADSYSLRYRKALMLISFCDNYEKLGQTGEALSRATEARGLLQNLLASDPTNADWRLSLARAEIYVGVYLDRGRKLSAALESFRDGLAVGEQLLRDEPNNLDVVTTVARILVDIGSIQLFQGSSSDAMASYTQALRTMVRFANGNEDTNVARAIQKQPGLQYMVNEIADRLMELQTESGLFDKALQYNKEMLASHET
ncbi:MAG: TIR domain-containing protein, partial [Candidatus Binataceae bacterium]